MSNVNLTVNGKLHSLDIDPDMPLLYALRNHLELNGAKYGCGLGQCGDWPLHASDADDAR